MKFQSLLILVLLSFTVYGQQQQQQASYGPTRVIKGFDLKIASDYQKILSYYKVPNIEEIANRSKLVVKSNIIIPKDSESVDLGKCKIELHHSVIPTRDVMLQAGTELEILNVRPSTGIIKGSYQQQGMSAIYVLDEDDKQEKTAKAREAGNYSLKLRTELGNELDMKCTESLTTQHFRAILNPQFDLMIQRHLMGELPKI